MPQGVDALEIKISDNANKTAKGLEKLVKAVDSVGGIDPAKFNGLLNSLNRLQNNLDTVLSTVNNIKSALGGVGSVKVNVSGITKAAKELKEVKGFTMVGEGVAKSAQEIMGITSRALALVQPQITALSTFVRDASGNLTQTTATGGIETTVRRLRDILSETFPMLGQFSGALGDVDAVMQGLTTSTFTLGQVVERTFGTLAQGAKTYPYIGGFLPSGDDSFGQLNTQLATVGRTAEIVMEQIDGVWQAADRDVQFPWRYGEGKYGDTENYNPLGGLGAKTVEQLRDTRAELDSLAEPFRNASTAVRQFETDVQRATTAQTGLAQATRDTAVSAGNAATATEEVAEACRQSNFAVKSIVKGFDNFFTMASRMLKRNIIRELFKGFYEGVKNLYLWSSALGDGGAFKNTMDGYATSLNTVKNSIGAAAGAVLTAFLPAIQTICQWLITGINFINQFIAALNGLGTWNRANDVATAFADTAKNAAGAAKSTKELLADWDELNVITSEGGSGGGSNKKITVDAKTLFTVDSVADGIKDITDWISQWPGLIDAAVAGLTTFLLTKNLGLSSIVFGITLGIEGVTDAINRGEFNIQNVTSMVLSAIATGLGVTLVSGSLPLGFAVAVTWLAVEWAVAEDKIIQKNQSKIFAEGGVGGKSVQSVLDEAQKQLDKYTKEHALSIEAYADFTKYNGNLAEARNKIEQLNRTALGNPAGSNRKQIIDLKNAWKEFDDALQSKRATGNETVVSTLKGQLSNLRDDLKLTAQEAIYTWQAVNGEVTQKELSLMRQRDQYLLEFEKGDYTNLDKYASITRALSGGLDYEAKKYEMQHFDPIDFGADNALDNALQFIKDMNTLYDEASKLGATSASDSIAVVTDLITTLEGYTALGLGDYGGEIEQLKTVISAIESGATAESADLSGILANTYRAVLTQALVAMQGSDSPIDYQRTIINPLIDEVLKSTSLTAMDASLLEYSVKLLSAGLVQGFEYDRPIEDMMFNKDMNWFTSMASLWGINPLSESIFYIPPDDFSADLGYDRRDGWRGIIDDFAQLPGMIISDLFKSPSAENLPNAIDYSNLTARPVGGSGDSDQKEIKIAGLSDGVLVATLNTMVNKVEQIGNQDIVVTINADSHAGKFVEAARRHRAAREGG